MANENDEPSEATPGDSEKPLASQAGNDEPRQKPDEAPKDLVPPASESKNNQPPPAPGGEAAASPTTEADHNHQQPPSPITPGASSTAEVSNNQPPPPSPTTPSGTESTSKVVDLAEEKIDFTKIPDDAQLEANFEKIEPFIEKESEPVTTPPYNLEEDREGTRSVLARGLLWLLTFVIGAVLIFVGLGRLEGSAVTQTVFPALISLAGTALGFYFGSQVSQNK
jgi:hypothetical protein